MIWKVQKSVYVLSSAPRCWQDHLGDILRKSVLSQHACTCLWTHPTKRVSLAFPLTICFWPERARLSQKSTPQLRRDLELKSSELTTKPTRYLGRTLVRTKEVYNFGSDASCVQDMLEEFNMSALESTPSLRWDCRETDEVGLPANEQKVYRHLVGKLLRIGGKGFIEYWSRKRHGHEKHHVNPSIPPWKPWNHGSAADDFQLGSCETSS